MAIVQGYDIDALSYCTYELQSIGFSLYGLGSLAVGYAPRRKDNPQKMLDANIRKCTNLAPATRRWAIGH